MSAHSNASPVFLKVPARLLHRRCQTVWSSRGEAWGFRPEPGAEKISTDEGGLSQSPPSLILLSVFAS
jgi:hypothetical protein